MPQRAATLLDGSDCELPSLSRDRRSLVVYYPNLKLVQTGVTSTVVSLAPVINRLGLHVSVIGFGLPKAFLSAPLWRTLLHIAKGGKNPMVWHARRNTEMLLGVFLQALNPSLKLVFTSAALRHHSAYTTWLMSRMHAVVCTSAKSAEFASKPSGVIGHGIDADRYSPCEHERLKRELGLNPDANYIGCFGAVRPGKGTDTLVEALLRVLPDRPDWCAIICGHIKRNQRRFVQELESKLEAAGLGGRVRFLGHVEDAVDYIRAVDICVAPSRIEGFGLTVLEAMSAGVPVVASQAGAYPENVIDGTTGYLFTTGESEDLAEKLAGLMHDAGRRTRMGKAARQHVLANHLVESEARGLIDLYRKLFESD